MIAAARLFVHDFNSPSFTLLLNAFDWSDASGHVDSVPPLPGTLDLGDIWMVGTGSVGTSILFFLTLSTQNFSTTLFDMDQVKRLNITRSPIFTEDHIGLEKVEAARKYLHNCGVTSVRAEPCPLHESAIWKQRQTGSPDLLISAANELNVRHGIENQYPPIQIYGTTGQNWQAATIRHIPLLDPCSVCLFPNTEYSKTLCATDTNQRSTDLDNEQVDAALPFLSFAAGLMATAEILKLTLPEYPFLPNRTFLNTLPEPRFVSASMKSRKGCLCTKRSNSIHSKLLAGSRFAHLSARQRD
ncbi:ThiF family adenylyltransferase [Acidobacteria bacterium AH-259-O06]|nr:ThiF family adenylyltransferase [Acidobacteria bacterium AH-259-O06]